MINSIMIKLTIICDIGEVFHERKINYISFTKDGITIFLGML